MQLTDAQMEWFVPACENRLGQLSNAQLTEFELAMERTFMPYIRTQLEIFDVRGGFSTLPGMGTPHTNDLLQREDTPSLHAEKATPQLGDPGCPRASASADVVAHDENTVRFDWPDGSAMEGQIPAEESWDEMLERYANVDNSILSVEEVVGLMEGLEG
jgi:hypothetical protein